MDLPSFRSSQQTQDEDHISVQQRALKQKRSSRFDRLAPKIDLSRVSTASSPPLSRMQSKTSSGTYDDDRQGSYGFLQPRKGRSDNRLGKLLEVPGGYYTRGDIPHTGLVDPNARNTSPSPGRPMMHAGRHWSISDRPRSQSRPRNQLSKTGAPPRTSGPSRADIARIRALLMCSGIKAQEIARRAHSARDSGPSEFLKKAAETGAQELEPGIPKKEEHVVAARILVAQLEKETSTLRDATERFRADQTAALYQRLSELRHKLEGKAADAKAHPDTIADVPQPHASATTDSADENGDADANAAEDLATAREKGGLTALTHSHSIAADTLVKD
ncbi:hypothetical protein LTS18_015010, partial [Coniosporium uncinatum]